MVEQIGTMFNETCARREFFPKLREMLLERETKALLRVTEHTCVLELPLGTSIKHWAMAVDWGKRVATSGGQWREKDTRDIAESISGTDEIRGNLNMTKIAKQDENGKLIVTLGIVQKIQMPMAEFLKSLAGVDINNNPFVRGGEVDFYDENGILVAKSGQQEYWPQEALLGDRIYAMPAPEGGSLLFGLDDKFEELKEQKKIQDAQKEAAKNATVPEQIDIITQTIKKVGELNACLGSAALGVFVWGVLEIIRKRMKNMNQGRETTPTPDFRSPSGDRSINLKNYPINDTPKMREKLGLPMATYMTRQQIAIQNFSNQADADIEKNRQSFLDDSSRGGEVLKNQVIIWAQDALNGYQDNPEGAIKYLGKNTSGLPSNLHDIQMAYAKEQLRMMGQRD